jgi:hypothetical protein
MPPDVGLNNAIRELTAAVNKMAGGPVVGGSSHIIDPNTGVAVGGKNVNDILSGLKDSIEKLTEVTGKSVRAQADSKDTLTQHLKGLEILGTALALAGPMVSQYSKYSIARPYEMLGGTMGQVGGRMMERERDTGQIVTTVMAGLAAMIPGIGLYVSGAIVGLGAAGGNAAIGRGFFQEASIKAAGEEQAARMATERVIGARDSMMLNYRLQRGDVAGKGMRGQGGSEAAFVLSELGISGMESAGIIANVQAQGARGYSKFSMDRARQITNMSIYGQDIGANAVAMQISNRTGFSENELLRASERTGFQIPQIAQAMEIARGQSFMFGPSAGNRLFNMATSTTMAQQLNSPAIAMAALTQGSAGAAGAAGGNEASEMILFQQFQQANPGSSYMDFLEAKSMGTASPAWMKMMSGAAKTFGVMGQQGGLLGVGTGIFKGAGKEARDEAIKLYGEATGELDAGRMMGAAGSAEPSEAMKKLGRTGLALDKAQGPLMEAEFGKTIDRVTTGLNSIAATSKTISEATTRAANLMEISVVNSMDVLDESIAKWITKYLGGDGGLRARRRRPKP